MVALIWIVLALNIFSWSLVAGATIKASIKSKIHESLLASLEPAERSPKIVIIGAGASGISTAAKLLENGYHNIVILEAESRIGGRIHSIPFGKGYIDLGAQWCEGQGGNVVWELVKKDFQFGDLAIRHDNSHCYTSDGKLVDQNKFAKLMDLSESITSDYENMAQFNESFGKFFEMNYRNGLQDEAFADVDEELANQIMDLSERGVNIEQASETWHKVSAKLLGLAPINGYTQQTWKDHGYEIVFDFLTRNLSNPSTDLAEKIQFNREVTDIDWSSNEVVVGCADGSEYTADHVIVTVSLGFIREHHHTLFTPPLPEEKVFVIENAGFGTLGKIFLEFDKPFWPANIDDWGAYVFLWKQEDKANLTDTDREWLTGIDRFIRVDQFPNLISALTAGKSVYQFEGISNKELIDDCMWLLEKFLGRSLPRPISMRRSHWMTNKHFLGSYSFLSVDVEHLDVLPTKILAESLYRRYDNKPIVLFAGEATDEFSPGYVHGAVASGWRATKEIVDHYKSIK